MESTYNVAGIDVLKAMLAVVIGPSGPPEEQWLRRQFGTTTQELRNLAAWLQHPQVHDAAMESTAQYWKPVWITWEPHFRLHLAQARSNKAPKGRQSDFRDAVRIVKRLLSDDLTLSLVPDAEQRRWRLLTRTRQQLTRDRVRLHNHLEGLLEEGQIKLSSVISDLLGVSGYRILRAWAQGENDLEQLADLADPGLRVSRAGLIEALNGSLHQVLRRLLGLFLDRLDWLEQQLETMPQEIGPAMSLHQHTIARLCQVPGLRSEAAQQIRAELGRAAAAFASAQQASSWVGACPGREESAGESKSNRSPKGHRPMRRLWNQCAWAAVKAKDCFFQHL